MNEKIIVPGQRLGLLPTTKEFLAGVPRLARYLALPPPPDGPVDVALGISTWPMFLNDRIGDCACAAPAHMVEIFGKQATGQPKILEDGDVLALYRLQGYQPGDPSTDRGSSLENVLADWKSGRWAADQILAFASIDVTDHNLLKTSLWLFSGLYIAAELPVTAQSQNVWDVVAGQGGASRRGSWGGHAVNVVSLDDGGLDVITWGARKHVTWAFWDEYAAEAYAVIPKDYDKLQGRPVPSVELDEEQLLHDLALIVS